MTTNETETPIEVLPLDDAFIALLADLRRDAAAVEARAQGALMLFLRQHALTGAWQIAANGRELVRTPASGALGSAQEASQQVAAANERERMIQK